MCPEKRARYVHIVSHGPSCLDGVTAAVAVSRYARDAHVLPYFCSNAKINETLLGVRCEPSEAEHEVWITDIAWTDPAVDRHLQWLLARGVRVYWIDHHRTAVERYRRGEVTVQLTDVVLGEDYAASRLTYEYLSRRVRESGLANQPLEALERLVAMADDNDRWVHQIPGSRQLALAIGAMRNDEAFGELLNIDDRVTYTPAMLAAARRAEAEIRRSFEVAEHSRIARPLERTGVTLVTAVCDGYPSEIADAWGQQLPNAVFALFDARSLGVSLRRSPDCQVDLSQVAGRLGGGGHPAAAGCELAAFWRQIAVTLNSAIASAVDQNSPDSMAP